MNPLELSSYDFELPEERIAQQPIEPRDASRMLHLNRATGEVSDLHFSDFPSFLRPGDVLVLNETRVSARRIFGNRADTGGKVELLVMKPLEAGEFECLARPAKRLKPGVQVAAGDLTLEIQESLGEGKVRVKMLSENWERKLEDIGIVPLPPYIHAQLSDQSRYQTVYAGKDGSSAAPTAGLHFTPEMLQKLESSGVQIAKVSLDVSIDTFRPILSNNLNEHTMHGEVCRISEKDATIVTQCNGRVIAVGTTSVRTLESFAKNVGEVEAGEMRTRLFIKPGFEFRIVQGILTNFHMPKTSMLVMLAAFSNHEHLMNAYQHALQHKYRFLSFGDAMFLI